MATAHTVMFLVAVVSTSPSFIHSFQPLFSFRDSSITHRDITQRAILRKTAEVCRDIASSEGRAFTLTIDDNLSVTQVQRACSSSPSSTSPISSVMFQTAIDEIVYSNGEVDSSLQLRAEYHFDNETFKEGRDIITAGVSSVKANVRMESFEAGRQTLGQICHTLQDFYSHSNWVELDESTPYSALIRPDEPLENLAGPDTPTCRSCTGQIFDDNILHEVLRNRLLTSGYFNVFSAEKPAGKCSHGGKLDKSSTKDPVGGINKDTVGSSHGSFHNLAADLAVDATVELLEDIRVAVGDKTFLRFMGLSQSSVLCFAIDTTGSMSDDIEDAKRVSFDIIDSRRDLQQEPSAYILVPFNDPDFGPVIRTTDADTFKESINKLKPKGGGDREEMSLSALRLALTSAPPSSDIFVFTDAPAKDAHLKNAIIALIGSTKSEVNFMLTNILSRRRRHSELEILKPAVVSNPSPTQLYHDLAQASGGQAIHVTKADLSLATAVIKDSSARAVVTVFQSVINPGRSESFSFIVDAFISNMIIYITGASPLTFTLSSSTDVSQSSSEPTGLLANFTTVGNLHRLSLNTDRRTGLWELSVKSSNPYSVKVTGQSSVNFLYNLVEAHEGPHSDLSLKEGRPSTGSNVTLLVTVTGSDTAVVTGVTLFDSSARREVAGSLQAVGSGNVLVRFTRLPAGDFVVQLRGQDSSTSGSTPSSFQRQASTQIRTSNISVTAQADNINIEPGSTVLIPFKVSSNRTGTFTVRANNDRSYTSTSPSTLTIEAGSGGKANGTVTLTAPASAASGTDVTLTIEAENAAATDINYAVLRFSVVAKVTDFSGPQCQEVSVSGICPSSSSLCASSQWEFITNLTDGINGTGIESVAIRQGNGTLNTSTVVGAGGENVTVATYSASCCSQSVELTVVDKVGNVGTCVGQARESATAAPVTTTAVSTTSTGGRTVTTSYCLWISAVLFLLGI